jgi:hypothetical protein
MDQKADNPYRSPKEYDVKPTSRFRLRGREKKLIVFFWGLILIAVVLTLARIYL